MMDVPLQQVDPEVAEALRNETMRQSEGLELIASENFVSEAVLETMGSVFTNKYAEGYPGRRYYGGCEFSDVVERLARSRAKELFGAEHANVQPHSGSQANQAVYFTVLEPGDTVLLAPGCASFDMFASYAARGDAFAHAVELAHRQDA